MKERQSNRIRAVFATTLACLALAGSGANAQTVSVNGWTTEKVTTTLKSSLAGKV